mgnify:CR=1 FL=1
MDITVANSVCCSEPCFHEQCVNARLAQSIITLTESAKHLASVKCYGLWITPDKLDGYWFVRALSGWYGPLIYWTPSKAVAEIDAAVLRGQVGTQTVEVTVEVREFQEAV